MRTIGQEYYGISRSGFSLKLDVATQDQCSINLISDGTAQVYHNEGDDMIQIPPEHLVNSIDKVINKVFPNIEGGYLGNFLFSGE